MSHQAARPRRSLPCRVVVRVVAPDGGHLAQDPVAVAVLLAAGQIEELAHRLRLGEDLPLGVNLAQHPLPPAEDRKSTRLNSSHANISYAVFCLKKKKVRSPSRLRRRRSPCTPPSPASPRL